MFTLTTFVLALTFIHLAPAKPVLKVYQLDLDNLSDQLSRRQDIYKLPSLNKPLYIENKANQKSLIVLNNYNQIEHLLKKIMQQKLSTGSNNFNIDSGILETLSSMQLSALRNGNVVDIQSGSIQRGGRDLDQAVVVPENRVYLISNPEAILKAKLERNRKNKDLSEETDDLSSSSDDSSTSGDVADVAKDKLARALLLRNLSRRRGGRFSKVKREEPSQHSDFGPSLDHNGHKPQLRERSEDFNVITSYRTSMPFSGGRNRNIYE